MMNEQDYDRWVPFPPDSTATWNGEQPHVTMHKDGFEGYAIEETWFRDIYGQMRCDCRVLDPAGKFFRRYMKLEDAARFLRAHLNMERLRTERERQ